MTKKEQIRLEYFFRKLIFWDDCSYVLMGSKPCAIAVFYSPLSFNSHFLDSISPSNLRFWLGWKTWKKYENCFPHPCFSILSEKRNNGSYFLTFINKKACEQTISNHLNDFQNILGNEFNILETLSGNQPFMSDALKNDDFLIGIVLGFGRENAKHYSQKSKKLTSFITESEHTDFSKYLAGQGIWGLATGKTFRDLAKMPLPGFFADPNDLETIALREKYELSREKLIAHFHEKNFLDATLELFTAEPQDRRKVLKDSSLKERARG